MTRYTVELRVNGQWREYGVYIDHKAAVADGLKQRDGLRRHDQRLGRSVSQMRVRAAK